MNPIHRGTIVLAALAAGFAGGAFARGTRGTGALARAEMRTAGTPAPRPHESSGVPLPASSSMTPLPKTTPVDTAAATASAEAVRGQVEALRSRIAAAVADEDGRALLNLVRRLVALGEPGYAGALEALGHLVEAGNQEIPGLGLQGDEVWRLLGPPELAAFEVWVLEDGLRGSSDVRCMVASCFCFQPDMDTTAFVLERLRAETDPGVLSRLVTALFRAKASDLGAMSEVVTAQSANPDVASRIVRSMAKKGEAAWPMLQSLMASPVPEIATAALIWGNVVHPPVQGAVVSMIPKEWNSPMKLGDIIVSWEGSTIENEDQAIERFKKWPEGAKVNVVVHRDGVLVPVVLDNRPQHLVTTSTLVKK